MKIWKITLNILFLFLFYPHSAFAVRPFITDDARVVGEKLFQIETWLRLDSATLQHWILPAYGPTPWLEVTAGGFHGSGENDSGERTYSVGGPLIQSKALLREAQSGKLPGIAVAAGIILPGGTDPFKISYYSPYGYVAATQNINREQFLIHANAGLVKAQRSTKFAWGVGSQYRIHGGLHALGEIVSGDPYSEGESGGAVQIGVRYFVSPAVQTDGTYGVGIWGNPKVPAWGSIGVRWVVN